MPLGRAGDVQVDLPRPRLLLRPLRQTRPVAHQTLVRHVDDGAGTQRHFLGRHEERAPRPAEDVDDRGHLVQARAGHRTDLGHGGRPADAARVRRRVGEDLEHLRGDGLPPRIELAERLLRVLRERALQGADGFVVPEVERCLLPLLRLPPLPRAHQGMLQDGELVGIVADVVEQA